MAQPFRLVFILQKKQTAMKKFSLLVLLILLPVLHSCSDEFENAEPQIISPGETDPDPDPGTTGGETVAGELFTRNDELFGLLKRATRTTDDPMVDIACVEFIYPIIIKKYDENLIAIQTLVLQNDTEFYNFLVNLDISQQISLSYPISTVGANGQPFSINNNEELKQMLKNCSQQNTLIYVSGIFGSPSQTGACYWRVPWELGRDNRYAGGIFLANQDNSLVFDYDGQEYPGNWIFLFVGDELHMNINLEGTSEVAQYWNIDRKIDMSSSKIELYTTPKKIRLEKYCGTLQEYAVGDTGPGEGIVFYDKGEYSHGWRYIEVTAIDLAASQWGCAGSLAYESAPSENGMINSARIANYHDSFTNFYINPSICNSENDGTVSARAALLYDNMTGRDWFLPSENELQLIYANLYLAGLGNFSAEKYWSSNEVNEPEASVLDFAAGMSVAEPKIPSDAVHTRAVRYF